MVTLHTMEGVKSVHIYKQMVAVARLAGRAYRPYKRQIFSLAGLSFLGGLLEGIGINAVIPLLTFVLGVHDPATDTISLVIQNVFAWMHVPFVPKFLLTFIVVLFVGKACIALLISYIQILITNEYERATRAKLFRMVLSASWPYLLRQKLGNLETALMIDTPAATSMLSKISFTITVATSLLMYLIVAFSISAPVTLATFLLGVIVFVTLRPLMDRVHAISSTRASAYRDTLHHISAHVGGLKTVKSLGVETQPITRGAPLLSTIKELTTRIAVLQTVATQAVST